MEVFIKHDLNACIHGLFWYVHVCVDLHVGRTDATDKTTDSKSTEQNQQV